MSVFLVSDELAGYFTA